MEEKFEMKKTERRTKLHDPGMKRRTPIRQAM
jgi:hypothetical protein